MDNRDCFYKDGLHFDCNGCSKCCRFAGGVVLLSQSDLSRLAQWTQLTCEQFITVYCRYLKADDGKEYLCLKNLHGNSNDGIGGDCVFWDSSIPGCQAYEARPDQCRSYPFWTKVLASKDSWDKEIADCPGINQGPLHTQSEIEEQLALYKGRIPLTK